MVTSNRMKRELQIQRIQQRQRLRKMLLENLEQRQLLAFDAAGPVFAQGTPQSYVDEWINRLGNPPNDDSDDGSSNANVTGRRWTDPAPGPSPGNGNASTVTWSIVPDGTSIQDANGNETGTSDLVAFLDGIYGTAPGPFENRPWFPIVERMYQDWSNKSGINLIYEPSDDGAASSPDASSRGVLGVRGDMRVMGQAIDGNFGILAFNYFPNNGGASGLDGDMVVDTSDIAYANNAESPTSENRFISNVWQHEVGHGIGLGHTIPTDETKLMEPFISTAYFGAQHDDIIAAQTEYGDRNEPNSAAGNATDFGNILNGIIREPLLSINTNSDVDFFRFVASSAGRLSLTATPVGLVYEVGNQFGPTGTVNTFLNRDLSIQITSSDGTVLIDQNATGLGEEEAIVDFQLPAGGEYFVTIRGAGSDTQLYDFNFRASGFVISGTEAIPPRLLSVAADAGDIFNFNRVNQLSESPRELVFRFDGANEIDPDTLSGLRVLRAMNDGEFINDFEVIEPAYVGFGATNRIVVMRFAEPLVDDVYRIEALSVDLPSENRVAIRNLNGDPLRPRRSGTDRDAIFLRLNLGAQIDSVVPQPVVRDSSGNWVQQRRFIDVYFNGDKLHDSDITTTGAATDPTVVDPDFYQLILTNDTVTPNDDEVIFPDSVRYDFADNKVQLVFARNLDAYAGGSGTFRLKVGSREVAPSAIAPSVPSLIAPAADPGGNITDSFNLGTFSSSVSSIVSEQVVVVSNPLLLDYPGSNFDPGHRDIQDENHLIFGADGNINTETIFYTFALDRPYGVDQQTGQPLTTSISPIQMERYRDVFSFYSAQLGIDFVETTLAAAPGTSRLLTVVVGDMAALGTAGGPGGVIGIADPISGLAILDSAESWDNGFGYGTGLGLSFFDTALHEVGHLLGLGHSYEQPPGTIMGSEPRLTTNPLEWLFPGQIDTVHGQHIHRPDNRDVDLYRFVIPGGSAGIVSIEAIAERLQDSSNLDTHLTLMQQTPNGLRVVSANDNYFSNDSFLQVELTAGEYFVAVTAKGNEHLNAEANDASSGGVSEGSYELRVDFKQNVNSSIVDLDGTALDGDGDGLPGGDFNFWFRANRPETGGVTSPKTIYVNKDGIGPQVGSISQPFRTISAALSAANAGDIVRILPTAGADGLVETSDDNRAYEIGNGGAGVGALSDGSTMIIPRDVTVMVDAGAIFKLRGAAIEVGSSNANVNLSGSALQILGTPDHSVLFTSYFNEDVGVDTNPLRTSPTSGDWGGLEFRSDIDRQQGQRLRENEGTFLNYVAFADMTYGGGLVSSNGRSRVVAPISLTEVRPNIYNNTISLSADSGISADPNSFEYTRFTEPRHQLLDSFTLDYERIGPEMRGNRLVDNSINGLFLRIDTLPGNQLKPLSVAARLNDRDLSYVLGENLIIQGTTGDNVLESESPDISLIAFQNATGGSLTAGTAYEYVIEYVDVYGGTSMPSAPTPSFAADAGGAIRLTGLPAAPAGFVGRRLYRAESGTGAFELVARMNSDSVSYADLGATFGGSFAFAANPAMLQRARRDASLVIDPGTIIKALGSRIEVGVGATLLAEGSDAKPIIFTSRLDDRYGAGGTFDTNNDQSASSPSPGDWGGLVARHLSDLSLDSSLVTFGGGETSVPGGFASFNAVEIHQATARIANSVFEFNASGTGTPTNDSRDSRGPNDDAAIYITGSQPVIINNIIRESDGGSTAAISIDANSLTTRSVIDMGRQTGLNDRVDFGLGNFGPLVQENRIGFNGINGMRVRGATLTTASVWDDADIVHVVEDTILIPDYHASGGLRLQSKVDRSLVVKLFNNGGFTAGGRPIDNPDRIGGSLQVIGSPGFPVYLTSLLDDTIGAGFDPDGRPQNDTDGTGTTSGAPGDWRSIRLDAYSNDRNVETTFELEPDKISDAGFNDVPADAQQLGGLAPSLTAGDENLRYGFTLHGSIAAPQDLDVYQFVGTAGTPVWLDIDQTGPALDSVVELIDSAGNIIALSDNSFEESQAGTTFSDAAFIDADRVNPVDRETFAKRNALEPNVQVDYESVNPLDAGFRVVLPGVAGTTNQYFVRVRSSNRAPGDVFGQLTNSALVDQGITTGPYRLQLRLQQTDEIGGSTIRFADIRFATNGIEAIGLPGHSPLLGESAERANDTGAENPAQAVDVGNIGNTARSSISIAGQLSQRTDVDWFRFNIARDSVQSPGNTHLGTTFDIDYADGLGRADTTLWVFRQNATNIELVLMGTDSNIVDDQAAPNQGSDVDDLSRGSFGTADPFIGSQELPDGEYLVAVTNTSFIYQKFDQYTTANTQNLNFRVEPLDGFTRITEDRFGDPGLVLETAFGSPSAFASGDNAVPFDLSDVTLFVSHNDPDNPLNSRLLFGNAQTAATEAIVSSYSQVTDIAVDPSGIVNGFALRNTGPFDTDANSGGFMTIDGRGNGTTIGPTNAMMQTFEVQGNNINQAQTPAGQTGHGTVFTALSYATTGTTLSYWGVGSRGNGQRQYVGFGGRDPANNIIPQIWDSANGLYRIQPNSATIISAAPGNRNGDEQATGMGTNFREFARFDSAGTVTGLTELQNFFFAVSDVGELFILPISSLVNPLAGDVAPVATVLDDAGNPIAFTGLSVGPRNMPQFANLLFGITEDGTIHAFDFTGTLQPIFPRGATSMQAPATQGFRNVNGIDFSSLDVNLWHVSDFQGATAGHGQQATFNDSRVNDIAGGNSLYFGFGNPNGAFSQPGDWTGAYDVQQFRNTYDLPGGAQGAIETDLIDLREVSSTDQPTLYFTYRLDNIVSNEPFGSAEPMLEAFRVYGAGEDGEWILLGTNNSAGNSFTTPDQEFLPNVTGNADPFGNAFRTQELFDNADYTLNNFRQARISLAPLAGKENVRLRFEFSTDGSFETGDPLRHGSELYAVAGHKIDDGDAFAVTEGYVFDGNVIETFEFDLGLVLNLPSGASVTDGDTLTVDGTTYTFRLVPAVAGDIGFAADMSSAQLAAAVSGALAADGFTVVTNPERNNVLNVTGLPDGGVNNVGGSLDPAIVIGLPGVAAGNNPVFVNHAMTLDEVTLAVREGLAAGLNVAGQETNIDVYPAHRNAVKIFNFTVVRPGPLGSPNFRVGDFFGTNKFFNPNAAVAPSAAQMEAYFRQVAKRAQNPQGVAVGQGVSIDDIMIGLAERGEMVFDTTGPQVLFTDNTTSSWLVAGGLPQVAAPPTMTGAYQLEIRTSADYGVNAGPNRLVLDPLAGARAIAPNERLSENANLTVLQASGITDGDTMTLSDGINSVTFEFDVTTSAADIAFGVTPGNVRVPVSPSTSDAELAAILRRVINRPTVQSRLAITAGIRGEMIDGAGNVLNPNNSNIIEFHGPAAATLTGSLDFGADAPVVAFQSALDTGFGEDEGDSNTHRDQGRVVISSNTIRNSSAQGILVDAGVRQRGDLASDLGDRPYPGAARNLVVLNPTNVAPGVVVVNNIVSNNGGAGIRVSGDTLPADQTPAPTTIARVVNNTVFGNSVGIQVDEGASPTLLNNVIANNQTGVSVTPNSASTVLGGNLFKSNQANVVGIGLGSFPVVLTAGDPLFVDENNQKFYPAPDSRAIDSSLASLGERFALTQVKNGIGQPTSPIIAPDLDVSGLLRRDDPNVNTPAGQGQQVFIDRGAVDRTDLFGPEAILIEPLDNDTDLVDNDRNLTYVRLTDPSRTYSFFSILIDEQAGSGPDPRTITSDAVLLTENGRLLLPDIDYVFGYSVNTRTIRLTPLSGQWRQDSVYEIALINRQSARIDATRGVNIGDGEQLVLGLPTGGDVTFEYDSGHVVQVQQGLTLIAPPQGVGPGGIGDGDSFMIADGPLMVTFEFDSDGNVQAGNRAISIPGVATASQLRDIILTSLLDASNADLDLVPTAFGADGIYLGAKSSHSVDVTGASLSVDGVAEAISDGDRFTYTPAGEAPVIFEFDSDGSTTGTADQVISFTRSQNHEMIAEAVASAIAPFVSEGGLTTPQHVGNGVVYIGGTIGDELVVQSPLVISGTPGVTASLTLNVPSTGGAAFADGDRFAISVGASTETFELSTDANVAAGNRIVRFATADTAVQIANKIRNAINASGLGLAATSSNSVITLNEQAGTVFDPLTSALTSDGVAGGANPIQFVPSFDFTSANVAGQIVKAVNAFGTPLNAFLAGTNTVVIEGVTAITSGEGILIGPIADFAANELQPNRINSTTQFTIVMPEVSIDYGDANSNSTLQVDNGARHAILPDDEEQLVLGNYVDGDVDGVLSLSAQGDDHGSLVQPLFGLPISQLQNGPTRLRFANPSLTHVGGSVTITDTQMNTVRFEVVNGTAPTVPGSIPVDIAGLTTSTDYAAAFASAVLTQVLQGAIADIYPIAIGNEVDLGDNEQVTVVRSAAGIGKSRTGQQAIRFSSNLASYSDGQSLQITDGFGMVREFILNDTSVDPAVVSANVINIDLSATTTTSDVIAQAFANAINAQVGTLPGQLRMPAVSISGDELTFRLDDEDGVRFIGLFNASSPPVDLEVNVTFSGMIDAWIDWNADGDFDDVGEKILHSQPILAGTSAFPIATPATAVTGSTFARVRYSKSGNLLTTGVGVGGEVEDYLVEVVAGTPPVGVDDNYTVAEDLGPLVITVANGVLANDTDAQNDPISVRDEDPTTAAIDPVRSTRFGSLVLNSDGSFTYNPDPDFFGTDTFVYVPRDSRLSALTPATVTITVTPENDAPTANDDELTILEDEVIDVDGSVFTANDIAGPSNESGQTLTLVGATLLAPRGNGESVSVVGGRLQYTPPTDYNDDIGGPVLIQLTIEDGGDAGGAANPLTATSLLTLSLTPQNDIPTFTLSQNEITVLEDNEQETGSSPTTFANFAEDIAQGPATATDELANQSLTFTVVSNTNVALFDQQPAFDASGTLTFVTGEDQNGQAVIVIELSDGGIHNPPAEFGISQRQTLTINVTPVNDAPTFSIAGDVPTVEDAGPIVITGFAGDFEVGPATATDESGQTFELNVTPADPSAFVVQPTISIAGVLRFELGPDVNRDSHDLRVFVSVSDNGPSDPPNRNTSDVQTFLIDAAPINDAPSFGVATSSINIDEDAGDVSIPDIATNIMRGPATALDEFSQDVNFTLTVTEPGLFAVQPMITDDGTLIFRTAANQNGRTVIVVNMTDDGPGAPVPNQNRALSQTITLDVNPINDAPQFEIPTQVSSNEDQGVVSVPGFATNILRGPVSASDEVVQAIEFIVVARDPSLFEIQPAISEEGTLTFKTAENVNRQTAGADFTIDVIARDNGAATPPPNMNESASQSFTIVVEPVNDPPIPADDQAETDEEVSITVLASTLLSNDVAGPDDETGQILRLTQIERSSANGGQVEPVFANDGRILRFVYTPRENFAGVDTIQYVVSDSGQTSGNADPRSATGTLTITVAPLNDAPEFVGGGNRTVIEDQPNISIVWATDIMGGPLSAVDENTGPNAQTVSFEVTAADPSLFEVQPTVDSDGILSFVPAADANGSTEISVVAVDDGPVGPGHVNRSAPQTFVLSITPVNDAPTFTGAGDIQIDEDSGPYSEVWATNIAPAAGILANPQTALDEQSQTVSFLVTNSNPNLFSQQPEMDANGRLTFTTAANAFGIVEVVVVASDDGPMGGDNTHQSQPTTITLDIRNVNDIPTGAGDAYSSSEDDVLVVEGPGVLGNDTDIDLPDDSLAVVEGTITSSLGATITMNPDGSFTYDPSGSDTIQGLSQDEQRVDTFRYTISDLEGAVSQPVQVLVTLTGVNDTPDAVDDSYVVSPTASTTLDILANDSDIDSAINFESIRIERVPINGTVEILGTGRVQYTPNPGYRGTDQFSYTFTDSDGARSNEATVDILVNSSPIAINDGALTAVDTPVSIDVLANDRDIDGTIDPSTLVIVQGPNDGEAVIEAGGIVRFTPNPGFTGFSTFTYTVADEDGGFSNVATVNVTVTSSIHQNPRNNLDVNASGQVSPIDALLVINHINKNGQGPLPDTFVPPPFLDVDGDGSIRPRDALLVINFLNRNRFGGGEGEFSGVDETFGLPIDVQPMSAQQMMNAVRDELVQFTRRDLNQRVLAVLKDSMATVPSQGVSVFDGGSFELEDEMEVIDQLSSDSWLDLDLKRDRERLFGEDLEDLLD